MDPLTQSSWPSGASGESAASGSVEREERQVSLYRVGALTVAGRRELCVIRNVSAGGLMLNSYSRIERGSRIVVEFKQGETLEGVVSWSNGNSVGVRLDRPLDVAAILAIPSHGPRPRMPRIDIACAISIRHGEASHRVRAVDISQGGVGIETDFDLPLGSEVEVRISGLPAEPAVVRWRSGDSYGLGFNRLLSVTILAAWLKDRQGPDRRSSGEVAA